MSLGRPAAKAPSVRRACAACHSGKTRCSEVLPCQVRPPPPAPSPLELNVVQSCLKRGLGNTCAYPDPDADPQNHQAAGESQPCIAGSWSETTTHHKAQQAQAQVYPPIPGYPPPMHSLAHPNYYDYSTFSATAPAGTPPATTGTTPTATAGTSTSTFRPNKRPRNLTEEETAAITRNFQRGAFFIGQSEPIRIDPRLPVRLTLAEGDQVHFLIGETTYQPMV